MQRMLFVLESNRMCFSQHRRLIDNVTRAPEHCFGFDHVIQREQACVFGSRKHELPNC